MKLMIIESPGKLEKLSSILGSDWKIAASAGQVRDLVLGEMGVEAPDFKPYYKLTERGAGIIAKLKNLIKETDAVYFATDPDCEGESISWHLQQCLNVQNPLRVTFSEITVPAVKAALAAPRSIDLRLVAAHEARRVLDRLIDYLVRPTMSRHSAERLSTGWGESVAVRLVAEREWEIRTFRPTNHFGAQLIFGNTNNQWTADWLAQPEFVSHEKPYFMDRAFAQAVAQVKTVIVMSFNESEVRHSPPPPFTTSTMQQAAIVALGLAPKAAMVLAQKLYEQGHITYYRTDNPNVSDDALGEIHAAAAKLGLDMAEVPRKFKAPEGTQVGHVAITPTHWDVEEAGDTSEERALYKMIRLRAIVCQLADACYAARTVRLAAVEPVQGRTIDFEAKGYTLIYRGWLQLVAGDQTEEADEDINEPTNPIPMLDRGQALTAVRGKLLEKSTKVPRRYTQASLVKELESEGMGRPATYATIIDSILGCGYVRTEKRFLVPTTTSESIVDSLIGKFAFIDVGFFRDVEKDLDRIAEGETAYQVVMQRVYGQLQRELSALEVSVQPKHPCPECGKPLRRIQGISGYFWGCIAHPDCSMMLADDGGKPEQKNPQVVSKFICGSCGKPLIHRQKKGKDGDDFWGCTGCLDGCKQTYPDKRGTPDFAKAS